MKRPGPRGELALLAIIMLVAVFFSTFRLDSLPRGLIGDEAVVDAQTPTAAPTATPTATPTTEPTSTPTSIPTYTFSGTVFFDYNGNGVRDGGEPLIEGTAIRVAGLSTTTGHPADRRGLAGPLFPGQRVLLSFRRYCGLAALGELDRRAVLGGYCALSGLRRLVCGGLGFSAVASVPRLDDGLVTRGPYALVRHPQFLAAIGATFFGILMSNPNRFSGFAPGGYGHSLEANWALFALALWVLSILEDREVATHFGEEYETYAKRVPRLFPN